MEPNKVSIHIYNLHIHMYTYMYIYIHIYIYTYTYILILVKMTSVWIHVELRVDHYSWHNLDLRHYQVWNFGGSRMWFFGPSLLRRELPKNSNVPMAFP